MADLRERFARWLYRRFGLHGRPKPVWAWIAEAALCGRCPRRRFRRVYLGDAPRVLRRG